MSAVEARLSALEAETWASSPAAAVDGRRYQARADAAVQAVLDADPVEEGDTARHKLPPILVANRSAIRVGTAGRYTCTHLVVPTRCQPPGSDPKTFCGYPFRGPAWSPAESLDGGEACDKCLPGLARNMHARQDTMAKDIVDLIEEVSATDPT